jgi:hypothetical protein
MNASTGWLGLIAGEWTITDDPRSCARRAVRAGRALGLRTLAVSTDERCLARLAADGWSLRPASSPDAAGLASAFTPIGNRVVPPVLLLADGGGMATTTAWVAALLGGTVPDAGAVARCESALAAQREVPPAGDAGRRYVVPAQDGHVIGIVEDVTAGGRGRDYDCPGGLDARTARTVRNRVRTTLLAAGLTRGPVEVTAVLAGRKVSIVDIAPGRIDACVASVVELATGYDLILGAVRSALAADRPTTGRAGARVFGARATGGSASDHPRRQACLRRADLRTESAAADAAWVGLPGLVSVRPGPDGVVTTLADDWPSAVRAAETAVARLAGRSVSSVATRGVAR